MKIYVRSSGVISSQDSFYEKDIKNSKSFSGNRLPLTDPDYKELIDAKLIRRMSKIIKMGVAAALQALNKADIKIPDAIITGTAYGCLEDTIAFSNKMVETNEEILSPAAFIQSTHNTIAAQIALIIKCHGYNNTFVSGGHSFEQSLLDATLLLKENDATNILAGCADEITEVSYHLMRRCGILKNEIINSGSLYNSNTSGTIAGEGAAFFVLTSLESEKNMAELSGMKIMYKPENNSQISGELMDLLRANNIQPADIGYVITGKNGNASSDVFYSDLLDPIFTTEKFVNYKHLCGEYPVAAGFAFWLACRGVSENCIPFQKCKDDAIRNILIVNSFHDIYFSLILISKC